jgi:cytochrome oxidase assembly protein ShyY1
MMDYDKTLEIYQKHGQGKLWDNEPDHNRHNKEKAWYERVKSKRTGEYYQTEDLIRREMVTPDYKPHHVDIKGKPLKYPIKHTNQIIRKRVNDARCGQV